MSFGLKRFSVRNFRDGEIQQIILPCPRAGLVSKTMNIFFRNTGLLIFGLLASVCPAMAANVLANPDFELDPAGQNQNLVGWTAYGPNNYNESGSSARSGSNFFKVYQGFTGSLNYSGIYQDYISGAGATYSADGWACTLSGD